MLATGPRHPLFPRLVLDAADVALRRGDTKRAGRLVGGLTVEMVPGDEVLLLTIQVRALGAAADREGGERVWEAAARILTERGESPEAARLLLALAENVIESLGAARADALATRALGIAVRANNDALASECRRALVNIRARRHRDAS